MLVRMRRSRCDVRQVGSAYEERLLGLVFGVLVGNTIPGRIS